MAKRNAILMVKRFVEGRAAAAYEYVLTLAGLVAFPRLLLFWFPRFFVFISKHLYS